MLINDLIQINGLYVLYENLEDAILREIKEEVGLDISKDDLHQFGEREFTIRDSNSYITYFYYIRSMKKILLFKKKNYQK